MLSLLKTLFEDLDAWIATENVRRHGNGDFAFRKCEIKLLGQMSLLANEKVNAILKLVGTVDLDAHLEQMDHLIKMKMIELLNKNKLVYDEDSEKIWIPRGSQFQALHKLDNLLVSIIDPESALVSKAIKAKYKNKQLIQDAIASENFQNLIDRIEANGGDLNFFLE